MVYENGQLRKIFGLKTGEVAGGCRISRNEELHKVIFRKYLMANKRSRMRWAEI